MTNRKNGKKKNEINIHSSAAEYLTFVAASGEGGVEIRYEDENIWLTQKLMAELYGVNVRTINEHIKKVFSDKELAEETVIRKFRITASDGKTYNTNVFCKYFFLKGACGQNLGLQKKTGGGGKFI